MATLRLCLRRQALELLSSFGRAALRCEFAQRNSVGRRALKPDKLLKDVVAPGFRSGVDRLRQHGGAVVEQPVDALPVASGGCTG